VKYRFYTKILGEVIIKTFSKTYLKSSTSKAKKEVLLT